MTAVDVLLAVAVSVSMLVGWWRGRRSVGLGGVHRIIAADGVRVTGSMRDTGRRTTFEARWQHGEAWCEVTFDLNEQTFAAFVETWRRRRGRP